MSHKYLAHSYLRDYILSRCTNYEVTIIIILTIKVPGICHKRSVECLSFFTEPVGGAKNQSLSLYCKFIRDNVV